MKERPILFSGPMIRPILDGRKTQTRRSVSPMPGRQRDWLTADLIAASPRLTLATVDGDLGADMEHPGGGPLGWIRCPFGSPGDRLWVREAFVYRTKHDRYYYKADHEAPFTAPYAHSGWKPSIHMPRAASRITLEVAAVRVERLQAISEADAMAEGVLRTGGRAQLQPNHFRPARELFSELWDSINGARASWESNPWVWVVEFVRAEVRK